MMNTKIRVFWIIIGVMLLSVNVWAASLEQLRDQFKMEENRIVAQYDEMARQPGANKAQLTEQMKAALKQNRQKYSALAGQDPRFTQAEVRTAFETGKIPEIGGSKMQPGYLDQVNTALAEEGLTLKSTGGSSELTPSHINADVDAVIVRADGSPATPEQQLRGLEILKEKGVSPGDALHENAARFDNKGQDLTIWKPDSPEGQQAKLTDHDAFKTEGGRHVTRNPGAVQDAHGEYLDNRSKFEAARVEGDLKTQGKSLVKAGSGEAAGIKTIVTDADGNQSVIRDSAFKKRNPELYEKAKRLKEYGTTHEAGITEVGDTPEVQKQKVQAFQEEMAAEMDTLAKEAKRKGEIRDMVRENFQQSHTTAEDPQIAERARGIAEERARVTASNEGALDAIAAEQQHGAARDTFTGGRKGPGDPGFVADAPEAAVVAEAPDNLLKTKVKGPSAANTNPGGMMEALGIPDNRPNLTPEQAGVEMPGRYTPEEIAGRTKWVQGDPELAKLAQPEGQKIGQVAGHETLAELGRGEGQPIDRARMKTGKKPAPSATALDAEMAAQAGEGRLVSDESLASRRVRMTGEKTPSLLEGGKSSSSHGRSLGTAIEESGTMRAIEGMQQAEQSALGKVGVQLGELGANASTARRGLNAAGGAAAGGLAVVGTAYESYTVSSGYSRAKILYDAAANAKTDEEREMLMAEADRVYIETSEHAATSAGMLAAGAASPIVAGGAMVGYGSYQATRGLLENTETGRKIDRAVQDTMYDKMTKLDDLGRTLSGQDTVDEQVRKSLSKRQDAWLEALRRGDIELQEGATVDDMLVLVERQEGRTASPQSDETLGDMRNVVKVVKPAPTRLVDGRELLGDEAEPVDELAAMMANAGDVPGGPGSWKDEGYDAARNGLDGRVYIDRFTGTSATGMSQDEMDSELMPTSVAVAEVDQEDIAEGMQRGRDRERKENNAKARAQQMADKIYLDNWNHTLDQVNAVIAQQNENDIQLIAQKTQEAITMIQNVQNGTMSDADFSDKMRTLENEFDQLDQAGRQAWTSIVDRMVNDQLNPGGGPGILGPGGINPANAKCAGNFTMDGQMNFTCGCPGYTFDPSRSQCVGGSGTGGAGAQDAATQILTSVPADQIDQRNISCNDASKSGGDTPASITVAMGPGSGTAQLSYNLYSVKDRIIAQYNGATVFDSGCTGGSQTVPIPVSGGGNVHIVVQPACAGSGTSWDFRVSCPGGQ